MAINPFNWTCPHCERDVTISEDRFTEDRHSLYIKNPDGYVAILNQFVVCPNPKCGKYTLYATLQEIVSHSGSTDSYKGIKAWRLVPWGTARTFPDYVPAAIREDYAEACSIVDLSPKAAATLARRAVQGIIRGYWTIAKGNLKQELDELSKRVGSDDVTPEIVESIDVVRGVGNIGAHMEKDINVIVDVEPEEAQLLIQLVETLIEDTYIARAARQQQRAKLLALKQKKESEKSQAPPATGGEQS